MLSGRDWLAPGALLARGDVQGSVRLNEKPEGWNFGAGWGWVFGADFSGLGRDVAACEQAGLGGCDGRYVFNEPEGGSVGWSANA
jgi:hypothetical protein